MVRLASSRWAFHIGPLTFSRQEKELYDLSIDPYELEKLAGSMPELEIELSARL